MKTIKQNLGKLEIKKTYKIIRRYIRLNINSIKFSWDADTKVLVYYLFYKLAAFFKK